MRFTMRRNMRRAAPLLALAIVAGCRPGEGAPPPAASSASYLYVFAGVGAAHHGGAVATTRP